LTIDPLRIPLFFDYAGDFSEKAGLYAQVMNFADEIDLLLMAQEQISCYS
jgi:hypothetical protein